LAFVLFATFVVKISASIGEEIAPALARGVRVGHDLAE
jgi:hypothetical protein